jgi:hypothetical protein
MQTKLRDVFENLEISDLMAKEFYTAILVFYPESKEAEQAAFLTSGIDMSLQGALNCVTKHVHFSN